MHFSYKKLWKLLIDKNMSKQDLMQSAEICKATVSKLNQGKNVTTDVLLRICSSLSCEISDIMEIEE
ncbi:XRE family transcriptional regulator [Candidatus Saccharibacteria bacterium]|nr:XRE family transcriptional regulator [Candidatus Saccharibacteria bacterium]